MRAPVPAPFLSSWAQRNLQAGGSEVRRIAEPKKRIEKEENAKHRSCRDFNCILHTNWETTTKSALTKQLIYRLPSIKLLLHGSFRTLTQRLINKEWRGSSYAVFRLKVLWIPPIVVNASGVLEDSLGGECWLAMKCFFIYIGTSTKCKSNHRIPWRKLSFWQKHACYQMPFRYVPFFSLIQESEGNSATKPWFCKCSCRSCWFILSVLMVEGDWCWLVFWSWCFWWE